MAFKVTANHWDVLVNFMELHPDLAKGRINGPTGKDTLKRLWAELTIQLNTVGSGERPVQKWQKTWTDFKYALKKKAQDIKGDISGTEGGPAKGGSLTDLGLRVLNLLGKTFHEGLGRADNRCNFMNLKEQEMHVINPKNDHVQENSPDLVKGSDDCILETSVLENWQVTNSGFENEKKNNTLVATPSGRKVIDHDYIKQPSSSRPKKINPEKEIEVIYKETLSELKDINSTLKQIANTGNRMEARINRIADALAILASHKS